MWLALNNAFLSIVAHRDDPTQLLVRARVEGDIEAIFPTAKVTRTPNADYLFRATIKRTLVADTIGEQLRAITYDNFKNSVQDGVRHDAYKEMWGVMSELQHQLRTD